MIYIISVSLMLCFTETPANALNARKLKTDGRRCSTLNAATPTAHGNTAFHRSDGSVHLDGAARDRYPYRQMIIYSDITMTICNIVYVIYYAQILRITAFIFD